eukprot:463844-Amphidinium_carterae.1
MDYTFLKHQGEPVTVEHKGVTQYALGEVKKFILENGFINSVIQVDGGPAIKRFAESLISPLNGEVSEQFDIPISEITTNHPFFPWMVKHLGFTHNRFPLGQDGQTPYSRTWVSTRQRPESMLQKDDVMPSPGDNIQQKGSTFSQPAAATSSSGVTSSNQFMERGQPVLRSCRESQPQTCKQHFSNLVAVTEITQGKPPKEFYINPEEQSKVWSLNKAPYGLKNSPKLWQKHLVKVLVDQFKMSQLMSAACVFKNQSESMFILNYVDDLLIIGVESE